MGSFSPAGGMAAPARPRALRRGHRHDRRGGARRRSRWLGPPRRPRYARVGLAEPRRVRADGDAGRALRRRRVHRRGRQPCRGSHRDVERQQLERGRHVDVADLRTAASPTSPCPAARSTPVAASRTRGATRTPTSSRSGTARAGSRSAPRPGRRSPGNVTSLQIIGQTLYVGGEFQNGAGNESADYLLACDLATGAPSHGDPPIRSRAPCTRWRPTATARSTRAEGSPTWRTSPPPTTSPTCPRGAPGTHGRGRRSVRARSPASSAASPPSGPTCTSARTRTTSRASRRPTTSPRWNGSAWSAVGAGSGGANGWFPATASIEDLAGDRLEPLRHRDVPERERRRARRQRRVLRRHRLASARVQRRRATARWIGDGLALALVDRQLYAAGSFTSAGGDPQAHSVASFALSQVIAYPTPTVTAGPSAVPTPTVTPGPSAVPTPTVTPAPDAAAPRTSLRKATDRPGPAQGDVQVRLQRAGLQVPLQARQEEVQAVHLAEDLQAARARRAHVPRQGARPRRQRRCLAGGQAVQDQEAIALRRGRQATGRT